MCTQCRFIFKWGFFIHFRCAAIVGRKQFCGSVHRTSVCARDKSRDEAKEIKSSINWHPHLFRAIRGVLNGACMPLGYECHAKIHELCGSIWVWIRQKLHNLMRFGVGVSKEYGNSVGAHRVYTYIYKANLIAVRLNDKTNEIFW